MRNPFKFNKEAVAAPVPEKPRPQHPANFAFALQDERIPAPTAKENTGSGWVEYGADNRYPEFLLELVDGSALHGGIVAGKSFLVAGGGILVGGVPYQDYLRSAPVDGATELRSFVENAYGEHWSDLKAMLATDFEISGSFALEVIWSLDFSRIAQVRYIPWNRLRPAVKDEDGRVPAYYYANEWKRGRMKEDPERIQAFSILAHVPRGERVPEAHPFDHRQVLYVKNSWPGYEYFGRPSYTGAIPDIRTSVALAQWALGAAENGFSPSVVITFNEPPQSKEEGNSIARSMQQQFSHKGNARKIAVLFANSKETAPTIDPLSVKNIDESVRVLLEQTSQAIVTGHSVTSPELVGVSVPGQLGSGDISTKWNIFSKTVVKPSKAVIERAFNTLASINGVAEQVTFEDINPLV